MRYTNFYQLRDTAEQDVGCLVPSDVMLLMGVAFARWLG
jgi:hypothetical protein